MYIEFLSGSLSVFNHSSLLGLLYNGRLIKMRGSKFKQRIKQDDFRTACSENLISLLRRLWIWIYTCGVKMF